MRTLRFFFHIGSVECVTFQVPVSHWRVGGGIVGEGVLLGREEGARRVGIVVVVAWVLARRELRDRDLRWRWGRAG